MVNRKEKSEINPYKSQHPLSLQQSEYIVIDNDV